jgi:hypothetical protein
VKLLERAASTAVHTVRHPISTASYAVGIARGVAGAAIQVARPHRGSGSDSTSARVPEQTRPTKTEQAAESSPEPQRVGKPMPPPYATDEMLEEMVVIEPEPPHESFATEPKAVSRESAHGDGAPTDAEIDRWVEDAANGPDVDIETPVATTGAGAGSNPDTAEADLQQPGTEPLLDPGTVKSVLKESEILRKAADPDKG